LLLVVLVAAVVFAGRVALARASSEPRPVTSSTTASSLVRGSSTFASSPTGAGGGGPPSGSVTVHVVGQVRKPGVVRLPAGSRVADALAKAGGAMKSADLGAVNLARVLVDGEQVRVPRPGEVLAQPGTAGGAGAVGAGGSGPGGSGPGGSGAGGAGPAGGLVDLNTATAAELEQLPGVGPVLAQRILDWRTEHGRFTSVDELGEVSGIGDKIFAQLQPKVTV
jgi:competence protein ComEA